MIWIKKTKVKDINLQKITDMIKYKQKVSDHMNKGFVTSALLYGILSLFLVLVLSTVATIGNRKVAIDKIKQSALEDVQELTTPDKCFTTSTPEEVGGVKYCAITKYTYNESSKCSSNVFIPKTIGRGVKKCTINAIRNDAFSGQNKVITVTIPETVTNIEEYAFNGCSNITFIAKGGQSIVAEGSYDELWGAIAAYMRQG